ncbi:MAG: response regulator [Allomuricauda sp.]|nr:MAG: response regulator [Allomuricauda sp.]
MEVKVLAIDDQEIILLALERRLGELGYQVKTTDSGEKGIQLFHSFAPDLVLVDINMPGISGLDVVRYIRNESDSNTPIIVVSGNIDENVIDEGFKLGIDDYMRKPVSLDELHVRISRIIGIPIVDRNALENV